MTKLESLILSLVLCLPLVATAPTPATAAEEAASGLDPVISEVLEMLEAGVSDDLIIRWLQSTDRRPADVSADGLIALSRAEASEDLVGLLLEMAGGGEEAPAAPQATEPGPAARAEVPPSGRVETHFRISAKQLFTEEPEPDRPQPEPWDVFVYLDGEYLGWVEPSLAAEPVEIRKILAAGRHQFRVVLERHDPESRSFRHDSLSVPIAVDFEAMPGQPVEIEIFMKRLWGLWTGGKSGGPLRYRVQQGTGVLAEHEGTGGNPNDWRPVCEDIEANFPADAKRVPSIHRTALSRCVRWGDLWPAREGTTPRQEILDWYADHDYRPPLRNP